MCSSDLANKVALGHHRDDIIVTLLMNMFFGGRMKAMPPKLVSDDGKHIVIRPLAYVAETDLERWAAVRDYPIIPCTLCGSQEGLQRAQIKAMLQALLTAAQGARNDRVLPYIGPAFEIGLGHVGQRPDHHVLAVVADQLGRQIGRAHV